MPSADADDVKSAATTVAVRVEDLVVEITSNHDTIVDQVSFELAPGEIVGLVGESGCGKTTVGMALLGHARPGARISGGKVVVGGVDMTSAKESELRAARGSLVTYIPQDPPSALNPTMRIGELLREALPPKLDRAERDRRLREDLESVLLPSDDEFLRRYPHQLSGGQQQRLMIGMAFARRPALVVCDEPTTGLDVSTQAHIIELIAKLCRTQSVAALYVSHDLAVVSDLADRVLVMYGGRVVEAGSSKDLFVDPRHPYSRRLLLSVPDFEGRRQMLGIPGHAAAPGYRPSGCYFAPRCELAIDVCHAEFPPVSVIEGRHQVRCYRASEAEVVNLPPPAAHHVDISNPILEAKGVSAGYGKLEILGDVSLALGSHECLALVGESGSGKTTLARCLAGIQETFKGDLTLRGEELQHGSRKRSVDARREIQYVFQNPYGSLNHRHTVGQSLTTPLKLFHGLRGAAARGRVAELLERVSLPATTDGKMPAQLSGGERQRVAIARALAAEPSVLICDEITSALDVSVQASIVDLLAELRGEMGLGMLFITHNLALIRTIADRIAVLREGTLVETGPTSDVFGDPHDGYTRELLDNTPSLIIDPTQIGRPLTPR